MRVCRIGEDIEKVWKDIQKTIVTVAQEVLGERRIVKDKSWYDEECKKVQEERTKARMNYIQRPTRAAYQELKKRRNVVKKTCRRKKRDFEKDKLRDLEEFSKVRKVRNFYQRIQTYKKGFQPRVGYIRDKGGNLLGGKRDTQERWREYFHELLNEVEENAEQYQDSEEMKRNDEVGSNMNEEVQEPMETEIEEAIRLMKNNKSPGEDGITAELIKYGGKPLMKVITRLIVEIWQKVQMPEEWRVAILCPIFKKGDKTICENYRGIGLLNIVYKMLSKILSNRLRPFMEEQVGEYQVGFRKGKGTTDHIFMLRNILEKCYEYNIDIHLIFIDFKQAYDRVKRNEMWVDMENFGIPQKLIRLTKMTLAKSQGKVAIQGELSEHFEIGIGLREGDDLSTILFNFVLEGFYRRINIRARGTIYDRMVQCLAYADDIVLIGRSIKDLLQRFEELEEGAKQRGLQINKTKTKYMICTRNKARWKEVKHLGIGDYQIERVHAFEYLGTLLTELNEVSMEITARIAKGDKCYYSVLPILKSKELSWESKKKIYKTVIKPVVTYGDETWTLTQKDINRLGVWERKILRRIYGPKKEGEQWRIRTNKEIEELYNSQAIVTDIKIKRLNWLGHIQRKSAEEMVKKVFNGRPGGVRKAGRPRVRWMDDMEEDLRVMGVRGWKEKVKDRDQWKKIVREAMTLKGL